MFVKRSRYEKARPFVGEEGAPHPFRGVRPREIGPAPGVIEHTVRAGDRLDLLARHYYNDDRLWWRIVDANPEFLCGGDMVLERDLVELDGKLVETDQPAPSEEIVRPGMVGKVIVIPRARE